MSEPIVIILMGSRADLDHAKGIAAALSEYGLPAILRIGSAHKTPAHVLDMVATFEADPRPKVYITIAGRSNALSGFLDAQVTAPVIACPPYSATFGGADIFSSLRMPSGVAPAVVLDPAGAALLAAKVLGLVNADVQAAVAAAQTRLAAKIKNDDQVLTEQLSD